MISASLPHTSYIGNISLTSAHNSKHGSNKQDSRWCSVSALMQNLPCLLSVKLPHLYYPYRLAEDIFLIHQCIYLSCPSRSQDKDGIRQYEQWRGAEPSRVWAVCPEAQHPAAAKGLHHPAVHGSARQAHGLPQGLLWKTGKGVCWHMWL